jgi:hypothetical protein
MDIPTLRRLNARHRPLIVTPLGNDTILTQRWVNEVEFYTCQYTY